MTLNTTPSPPIRSTTIIMHHKHRKLIRPHIYMGHCWISHSNNPNNRSPLFGDFVCGWFKTEFNRIHQHSGSTNQQFQLQRNTAPFRPPLNYSKHANRFALNWDLHQNPNDKLCDRQHILIGKELRIHLWIVHYHHHHRGKAFNRNDCFVQECVLWFKTRWEMEFASCEKLFYLMCKWVLSIQCMAVYWDPDKVFLCCKEKIFFLFT